MSRQVAEQIVGFTGWHLLLYLLPQGFRTRYLARRVMRAHREWDFEEQGPFLFLTPWGDYEILDRKGRVRPAGQLSAGMQEGRRA